MITALLILIVLILLFGADEIFGLLLILAVIAVYLAGIALFISGLAWAYLALTA